MLLNRFEKFCIHCEHTLLSLYGLYIQDHWKIQVDVLWEQILKGQYSLKLKYLHLSHFIKLNIQVKKFINKIIANNCIFWIMECLIIPQRILSEQFKRSVFKKLGRALEIEIAVVRKQVFVRFMLNSVGNGYKWEFPLWTGTLDAFVKAKFKTGIYNEDLNPRVTDVQSSIFKIQHLGTPAKARCISQSMLVCVCFMCTIIKCLISQIFMHSIWASWDRIIFFNQTAEDPDLEILAWISILLEE